MTEQMIRAAHDSGPGNTPITRIVIHATCPGLGYPQASAAGQAANTARYFQQQGAGGSAHEVHDRAESVRCVPDDVIAWHAPPNPGSLGHEICGESAYTREQWLSAEVWPAVERCAHAVRQDAAAHGVPLVRVDPAQLVNGAHGICGHVDVSQAFRQSDHTDPGPGFPWDRFMALLTSSPTQEADALTPELKQYLDQRFAALEAKVATHEDVRVMIHGTQDGAHPANLTSIAKAVNVPGVQ